ncbi:hypothetical protein A10D4_13143 [Idiomarina xiamenensis 10-D-4]|uniref:Translocation and assembly module subunit TamA n=2 Tax=Idiomarina xiamenensis TaxID=1207041 RepID=K2KNV8_9GAMM|nr:hypothetical protein A10D4_13143 [Idiomarina xiamenensis 10-D-4]
MLIYPTQSFAQEQVSVEINGIDGDLLNNVQALLSIYTLREQSSVQGFRVRYLHRQANAEIKKALQPFGYYNPVINGSLKKVEQQWQAQYQIAPGPAVTIAEINWQVTGEGEQDPTFSSALNELPLKTGQRFIHSRYQSAKTRFTNLAAERGYYQAEYAQHKVTIDVAKNTASIDVTMDTGPRYQIGQISFSDAPVEEALLRRYLNFQQGDDFSTRELLDLQVALIDSDYFATVEVQPHWQQATANQVPIHVEMTPNKRTHYRFGLGYGTDTGARLTFGQDRRWVNDKGHRFNGLIQLSQVQSTGLLSYVIPGEVPQTDNYRLTAEVTDKSNEGQESTLYSIGAADQKRIGGWQRTYALDWQREDFRLGEDISGSSRFLIPSTEWVLLRARDRLNINQGYRISLGLKGGADSALSDTNFATLTANAKFVTSVSERWRLLSRIELGATYVDNFSLLPPSLRFFAGGDNSVRGYAYEQLGPRGDDGTVIGGRYLAVLSAEVDYRFADNWRVAVFSDLGNAMIEPDEKLKQSVGFGIRWISPIGAVRLDLAQAIDEPGNPWRLHFTLGPDL